MKKKKILFVIAQLKMGGGEKSLIKLLNVFDYEKYDVYLQLFWSIGVLMDEIPKQVKVLPDPMFLQTNKSLLRQIWCPRYFIAHIRNSIGQRINRNNHNMRSFQRFWQYTHVAFDCLEDEYDAAIAWGHSGVSYFVIDKVKAKKKIVLINTDYKKAGYNRDFDFQYYKKFDHVLTVSEPLVDGLKEIFPEISSKISVLHDIIDANEIIRLASEENPFLKKNNEIIIVTVGRLARGKGYNFAVEACKILKQNNLRFKWFIIGEGGKRSEIENDIEESGVDDKMFLLGLKSNPYIYMKNADIYVQTSPYEACCVTLREARILEVPIVSTKCDGQIYNEVNGLVADTNGQSIADAIIRMISDETLRNSIVENLKCEKKGNTQEVEKLYTLLDG